MIISGVQTARVAATNRGKHEGRSHCGTTGHSHHPASDRALLISANPVTRTERFVGLVRVTQVWNQDFVL